MIVSGKEKYLEVDEVRWLEGYRVEIVFNDGEKKAVDLEPLVFDTTKTIFKQIQDLDRFKSIKVNPVGGVEWEGGIDLAPEYLKSL